MGNDAYIDLGYQPKKTDIICDFLIEPNGREKIQKVAGEVAAESSVGTWTDIHTEKPYMRDLAAKVFLIQNRFVKIAYPSGLFELGNMPQILSSVAGNIFGMKTVKNIRLDDIHFPADTIKSFKGPEFGIPGVRKLTRVFDRPLVGTIIKPKLGLNTKDHAKVAYEAWVGGCDVVKDDENLSSQSFNPFERRVKETLALRNKAEKETGEKKIYLPNVTAETNEMVRRAKFVKACGGESVMVDLITCGFSSFQTLRDARLGLVLHGHRAMHAAITRNKAHGISMLSLAKMFRVIGIDQLHIGTAVGKMEGDKDRVIAIKNAVQQKLDGWDRIRSVFAVCSGGLQPGHVPDLIDMMGKDIIIQMGGGIHGHPGGTAKGSMAARQAIEAVMEGKSLKEHSKIHSELAAALNHKW